MQPFLIREENRQPIYDLTAANQHLKDVEKKLPELVEYATIRANCSVKIQIIAAEINSIKKKKSFPKIEFMINTLSRAVDRPYFTELFKNTPQENEKIVFKIKDDTDLTFERFDEKAQNLLPRKRKNLAEEFNAMYKLYKSDNQINRSYAGYYAKYKGE
jgi:hypothetical protein